MFKGLFTESKFKRLRRGYFETQDKSMVEIISSGKNSPAYGGLIFMGVIVKSFNPKNINRKMTYFERGQHYITNPKSKDVDNLRIVKKADLENYPELKL